MLLEESAVMDRMCCVRNAKGKRSRREGQKRVSEGSLDGVNIVLDLASYHLGFLLAVAHLFTLLPITMLQVQVGFFCCK